MKKKILNFRKVLLTCNNVPLIVINLKNLVFVGITILYAIIFSFYMDRELASILFIATICYIAFLIPCNSKFTRAIYSRFLFLNHLILMLIISLALSLLFIGMEHPSLELISNYIFIFLIYMVSPIMVYHLNRYSLIKT